MGWHGHFSKVLEKGISERSCAGNLAVGFALVGPIVLSRCVTPASYEVALLLVTLGVCCSAFGSYSQCEWLSLYPVKRYKEACFVMECFLSQFPQNAVSGRNYSIVLGQLKHFEEAFVACTKVIELDAAKNTNAC